jgi:hypothetical protein
MGTVIESVPMTGLAAIEKAPTMMQFQLDQM